MTSILDIYNNIFHSPKKNDTTKIVPTILTPVIIKNNNNNNMTNISQQRLDNLNCVLGLDCSKWQPNITWSDAKTSGIQFAFVKITEGNTGHEDNLYNVKARILSAQQNGIKVGYYHFARPGNVAEPEQDANDELQNILSHIGFLPKSDLPVTLDIEAYSLQNIWTDKVDHMNRFVTTLINGLTAQGINPIFYSYKSFVETNVTTDFSAQPLWIAAYPNNPETYTVQIPAPWTEWKIWQFTEKGVIAGYTGDMDLDVMKKDYFNQF